MNDLESLKQTLKTARAVLMILEEQGAGYTALSIPASLKVDLNEKRKEVKSLETRIQILEGFNPKDLLSNLPRSVNFVGRSEQIKQCLEALNPKVRSWGVVIDGIGGVGKTTLAVEVAHRAYEQVLFDAYLFVSAKTTWLSDDGARPKTLSRSSLDAFCREFARLLNEVEIARMNDAEQRRRALLNALNGRCTLLIWDNLETLTSEERYLISDFLTYLPSPNKAIVTSRYRLGENAIPIRLNSLSEVESKSMINVQGDLFLRIKNELISSNEKVYRELYEASGGNPLALKWTLGLVAQKGYSLQGALQCLRNAVRSDDLYSFLFADAVRDLIESDKKVLVTLATFNSPITANALADSAELNSIEVSDSLGRLVTLSLVNDLEEERYGLHPLTRNFVNTALKSEQKIDDDPLTVNLASVDLEPYNQRKALRYLVDFAQQYSDVKKGTYKNFDELEKNWPVLDSSATTLYELFVPSSTKTQDKEAGRMLIDLATALSTFLWFRGYWDERIYLNEMSYTVAETLGDWESASWSAADVAWIYYYRAQTTHAEYWIQRMVRAAKKGGSRLSEAASVRRRGALAQQRGDLAEAERLYNEALDLFHALGEGGKIENEALVLNDLGGLASQRREYGIAKEYYNQALKIAQKIGDKEGQAMYIGNLSNIALDCSEFEQATALYSRGLDLAKEVRRKDLIANAQYGLARILEEKETFDEALIYAEESLQARASTGERNLEKTQRLVARLQQRIIDRSNVLNSSETSETEAFKLLALIMLIVIFIVALLFSLGYSASLSTG